MDDVTPATVLDRPAHALLHVDGLAKRYGDETALADVAFDVHPGEILGLIGPNGAGKTTLLEAVAGLLPVDAGGIVWCGGPLPPARRREHIFYMPDGIRPYGDQAVVRVLGFFAGVFRQPERRVADAVAALALGAVLESACTPCPRGQPPLLLGSRGCSRRIDSCSWTSRSTDSTFARRAKS